MTRHLSISLEYPTGARAQKHSPGKGKGENTTERLGATGNCDNILASSYHLKGSSSWTFNAIHQDEMSLRFQKQLHVKSSTDIHQDLRISRVEKNSQGVTALVDILKGSFIHSFVENILLVSISNGLEATERVSCDLLQAKTLGQEALKKFINERILTTTVSFYELEKKLKLSTFK